MGEFQERFPGSTPPPPPQSTLDATPNVPPPAPSDNPPPPPPPPPLFDPSRMVGIIRRKSLIKDLAAVYHAECLAYCQELLELQRKREEPYADIKTPDNSKKETTRPAKRVKKSR